jgi:hypothetical protein
MQPDAAAIEAGSLPNSRAIAAGKLRLVTLDRLDGRTLAARRANELADAFEAELGTVSGTQRLAVRRAAMLVAIAEDVAARQLAGETIDLDQVIRASNAARRAVLDLGLNAGKRSAPHVPRREQLLRGRAARLAALEEHLRATEQAEEEPDA